VTVSGNTINTTGQGYASGFEAIGSYTRLVDSHVDDNVLVASGWAYCAGACIDGAQASAWENVTIDRNVMVLNSSGISEGWGGGLYLSCPSLSLRGCSVAGNQIVLRPAAASATVKLYGAGLYSYKDLALTDCNVTSNRITAEPRVGVTVTGAGGGIYQDWNSAANYRLNITRSTLRANTVTVGGSCSATSVARGGGE
jgi:hypothetical protein